MMAMMIRSVAETASKRLSAERSQECMSWPAGSVTRWVVVCRSEKGLGWIE